MRISEIDLLGVVLVTQLSSILSLQPCLLDQHVWVMTDEERNMLGLASFQLAIHFLLHMYCRTRKKLR